MRHAPGSLSTSRREEGFHAAVESTYPDLKIVNEQFCMSDRARALAVAEDMLTAHPQLSGLFSSSEAATVGAAQALRARGLAGKVKLVGFDASPELQEGLRDGVIDALVVQDPFFMGFRGVETIIEKLRGETPEKRIDSPARAVTKADLDSRKCRNSSPPTWSSTSNPVGPSGTAVPAGGQTGKGRSPQQLIRASPQRHRASVFQVSGATGRLGDEVGKGPCTPRHSRNSGPFQRDIDAVTLRSLDILLDLADETRSRIDDSFATRLPAQSRHRNPEARASPWAANRRDVKPAVPVREPNVRHTPLAKLAGGLTFDHASSGEGSRRRTSRWLGSIRLAQPLKHRSGIRTRRLRMWSRLRRKRGGDPRYGRRGSRLASPWR
ncbi:MAG: substrate-binding domain-containing protein [Bryobacterales bacterium]